MCNVLEIYHVDYDGSIRLLGIAQVPSERVDNLKSGKSLKIHVSCTHLNFFIKSASSRSSTLKRVMDDEGVEVEIIINPETNNNGNSRPQPSSTSRTHTGLTSPASASCQ